MSRLSLSFAAWEYDRTRPLLSGEIRPEGIDLHGIPLPPEETFWRQLKHGEFDVSELSLAQFTSAVSRGDDRFLALPVFLSRTFRHSCIFINTRAGIREPRDLTGKRVGAPEYGMTALVYIRGMLQHEYGVAPESLRWFTARDERRKVAIPLPPTIRIEPIDPSRTLDEMLEAGEIDALFTARMPGSILRGSPHVARLFPDYVETERRYYEKTKIFPIMHTVVVRRTILDRHPWVARSLFKAFADAKARCLADLVESAALTVTLPWVIAEMERTQRIMGPDPWPYGIEANLPTLEALVAYLYEQHLSARRVQIEELFAPNAADDFAAYMGGDREYVRRA